MQHIIVPDGELFLKRICDGCPESYEVLNNQDDIVGYIRLRWGYLACEVPDVGGDIVYEHDFDDGLKGCFSNDDEANEYLNACLDAILGYADAGR